MYEHYDTFKGWTDFFSVSRDQNRYFQREFRNVPLAGQHVLEVGFGQGALMHWLASRTASVAGTEINERSIREARERGFTVFPNLDYAHTHRDEPFGIIIAFDVLEHLTSADLESFLKKSKQLLSPDGLLIVRVPNGRSPWGLANQYGDLTHQTVLSDLRLEQLGLQTGLRLIHCRDQALVTRSTPKGKLLDFILHTIRRTLNVALRKIYGLGGMPMEANIIATLSPVPDHNSRKHENGA